MEYSLPRIAKFLLEKSLGQKKAIIIFGPRRVGKTFLLKEFLQGKQGYLFVSGEDVFAREYLSKGSIEKLKDFIGTHNLLVIDEAQYIENIGLNLKLLVDHLPHVQIIATGSSSFDLSKQLGEPLTGRKIVIPMHTMAQLELNEIEKPHETKAHLASRLIFGSYPEIVLHQDDAWRSDYLHDLVSSYLLKDILAFEGIQKSKKLLDLLTLIAFQVGKEVSLSELGKQLSMSKATVEKYLDLLEKTFVLFNVRGFSRNLRKEVTKTSRYYFYDNGIRNAIIQNFNPLERRNDGGLLWENYLATERIKKQNYQKLLSRNYFWRTYDQKEIDWVEEREGGLFGYEFKWGKGTVKEPLLWSTTYPHASFQVISPENYMTFVS